MGERLLSYRGFPSDHRQNSNWGGTEAIVLVVVVVVVVVVVFQNSIFQNSKQTEIQKPLPPLKELQNGKTARERRKGRKRWD